MSTRAQELKATEQRRNGAKKRAVRATKQLKVDSKRTGPAKVRRVVRRPMLARTA